MLLIVLACSNQKQSDKQMILKNPEKLNLEEKISEEIAYVTNPRPTDRQCKSDILKAKLDIEHGKLVYSQRNGFKRYESDLRKICEEKGLEYKVELHSCVVFEGQTQGCYGAYMDKVLIDKFGFDFKDKLSRQADSLFLVRVLKDDIAISSRQCDERAKPILGNRSYLESTISISDLDLKRKEAGRTWPAIDLSFIIEQDGTISKFYSNNFMPGLNHNRKFKDQLYKKAVDYIETNYPNWESGKIKGENVRTRHNLRITFIVK